MSNIGKSAIIIPSTSKIKIKNNYLLISGKLGTNEIQLPKSFEFIIQSNKLFIQPIGYENIINWGTIRSLISQKIIGVTTGYVVKLVLNGVGYKAEISNNKLILKLGFSNLIEIKVPAQIKVQINNTIITLESIDKEKVTQFAEVIRSYKKPDNYKGKGIIYFNEKLNLKERKK